MKAFGVDAYFLSAFSRSLFRRQRTISLILKSRIIRFLARSGAGMRSKSGWVLLILSLGIMEAIGQAVAPLEVRGRLNGLAATKIYLERYDNKVFRVVDSAQIENGTFYLSSRVTLPELYAIRIEGTDASLPVFLENKPISLTIEQRGSAYPQLVVVGSASQDRFESFRKRQRDLSAIDFIKENPASIVSAYALFRNYSYNLSPDEVTAHLALLDSSLSTSQYVRILKDLVAKQAAVLPGNKAIDFVSSDPKGKQVRFSDHLGKGYVLLDFWAAWCGPCRRENPNIVSVYQKYKDKGFSVFGVSLDKDRSNWVKAIQDDGLDWTQVSDLAFWNTEAAALYGVRFIPSNLLIGPDGVIVARNIKGDDLQQKLKELYGY